MNLATPLEELFRLTPRQKMALKKLGIATAGDLLEHLPTRYEDPASFKKIQDVLSGEKVRILGVVKKISFEKTWKKKMNIAKATLEDLTGSIEAIWFRQPYIAKMLPEGSSAIFSGTIGIRKEKHYIANPTFEFAPRNMFEDIASARNASALYPIYPTNKGISSFWISKKIERVLASANITEFLPSHIVKKYNLPERGRAMRFAHMPRAAAHAEAAKKRFSFEKIFLLQLRRQLDKETLKKRGGYAIAETESHREKFLKALPFVLTKAQKRALADVLGDIASGKPMNRLLEGDVGSGKTAVAACAAYVVARNSMQATYMAPTEILARQHFDGFCKLLGPLGIKVGLLTSGFSEKFPSKINPKLPAHVSKSQLLKWAKDGEIKILIGTHALIEKKIAFKNLALAMVDEQHRFGTGQRAKLTRKTAIQPHFLTMSATPIPRTLALTLYADLDLSVIDELPEGRKTIETKIVPPKDRGVAYNFVREKLQNGEQAFVICPRIAAPSETGEPRPDEMSGREATIKLDMKSVKEEYKNLQKVFPEFNIDMIHGRLTPKEKDEVMKKFRDGTTNVLVSTSLIEVGVDVPNATIMMVEGAERFGLAQMHQFRGRVGRSNKQSYCFIFPNSRSETSQRRLKALITAKSGFELAEHDLEFRGAGELAGNKQWGISDIGMDALKNVKLVEAARAEAKNIIENNLLSHHPALAKKLASQSATNIHFE